MLVNSGKKYDLVKITKRKLYSWAPQEERTRGHSSSLKFVMIYLFIINFVTWAQYK